jgi:hypothetical protein
MGVVAEWGMCVCRRKAIEYEKTIGDYKRRFAETCRDLGIEGGWSAPYIHGITRNGPD